jgi:hypothetical protein
MTLAILPHRHRRLATQEDDVKSHVRIAGCRHEAAAGAQRGERNRERETGEQTTTSSASPLDGSGGESAKPTVSDFLTVQSLANFAAMTGSITAAWAALKRLNQELFSSIWVPFVFAGLFGVVSVLISLDGLRKGSPAKLDPGTLAAAIFAAVINSLVLASAVLGADGAAGPSGGE